GAEGTEKVAFSETAEKIIPKRQAYKGESINVAEERIARATSIITASRGIDRIRQATEGRIDARQGRVAEVDGTKDLGDSIEEDRPQKHRQNKPQLNVAEKFHHTSFGEVTVKDRLPNKKLLVVDEQGEEHTIKNPTSGAGNRLAARVKDGETKPQFRMNSAQV